MSTVIVLFNLKDGVSVDEYEEWARTVDSPTVNGLGSVDSFRVHRVSGLLMSEDAPPYRYVEVIEVADMDAFGADVGTEAMQAISAAFGQFADAPVFMLSERFA